VDTEFGLNDDRCFPLGRSIVRAILFIGQELPDFNQVLNSPGVQLPKDAYSDLLMVGVFCAMQTAFWIRMVGFSIPFRSVNLFLSHIFLFLGRLSFIFGSSLFAVVVFRHLRASTKTAGRVARRAIYLGDGIRLDSLS
jgi:hypothetical protein